MKYKYLKIYYNHSKTEISEKKKKKKKILLKICILSRILFGDDIAELFII